MLDDSFPLVAAPVIETIRQRTLQGGARLECQALAPSRSASLTAATAITLSIDGGHVRSVRSYQARSFVVIVAQVSNDNDRQLVFAGVTAEADHEAPQLRGVPRSLGATETTQVAILSDGAAGPRNLGQAASIGPTHHMLDWFHLAMHIQHLAQTAKGLPKDTAENCKDGAASSMWSRSTSPGGCGTANYSARST